MADNGYMTAMAKIQCNAGAAPMPLLLAIPHGVTSAGRPLLNANDHIPGANILPFGVCKNKPVPPPGNICVPITPFPWSKADNHMTVAGAPVLTKDSCLTCMLGGNIKFS